MTGQETDYSPASSAEVNSEWSCTSCPRYTLCHCHLFGCSCLCPFKSVKAVYSRSCWNFALKCAFQEDRFSSGVSWMHATLNSGNTESFVFPFLVWKHTQDYDVACHFVCVWNFVSHIKGRTQGCTNLVRQVARTTKFCAVAPSTCGCFISPFWRQESWAGCQRARGDWRQLHYEELHDL
jgi:hypothetical protein